jgi:hypothetical protein
MNVLDKDLLFAMADAVGGHGILFLTPSRLATDGIVRRALHLVEINTDKAMASALTVGTSPWHICTPKGGWVFFFPADEIDPSEDVQNPNFVYAAKGDAYHALPYVQWRAQAKATPRAVPHRNVWEHLLDDD